MSLTVIGLNHKSAPLDVRERVAFGPDLLPGALRSLTQEPGIQEALILSTCNRTEIYACGDSRLHRGISHWLAGFHQLESIHLEPYLYSHQDDGAVRHLLRVASGLDSMVLGEPQILGQVKEAFRASSATGTVKKILSRLFQHCFSVAKQVRTDTDIGSSPVSVAFAAVTLARQIFTSLTEQTVLLIGAGETIELTARHLAQQGVKRIIVANRTLERAHELAMHYQGYAIALTELAQHLPEADIVISSTASPIPVLGKGAVENALKIRKHRPMFMVDIAVPRDIEPQVADLADVYLYTVDDLKDVIEESMRSRREAAEQAMELIDLQVQEFTDWLKSLDAVDSIQALRRMAEEIRDEVLERAQKQLRNGKNPDEALEYLAQTLTNKLLHSPSAQMRQAGINGQQRLLDAANELFQLSQTNQQP